MSLNFFKKAFFIFIIQIIVFLFKSNVMASYINNEKFDRLAHLSSRNNPQIDAQNYLEEAKRGDAEAQYLLAICYYFGTKNVAQDFSQAVHWCELSTLSHYSNAQLLLGQIYEHGLGVAKDVNKAFKLYLGAANQNNTDAQVIVGSQYLSGGCVERNNSQAAFWYQKAADAGNPQAQVELGQLYLNQEIVVEGNGDPDKIAYSFFLKAAQQNYPRGLLKVAECLNDGIGVKQDEKKAVNYFLMYDMYANSKSHD